MAHSSDSSDILQKKWQQATYDKHRQRVKEVKSNLKGETALRFNDEEIQLQMRVRRLMAEERRQAVIDKQNHQLLQRIVNIMTSKKKTFPDSNTKDTKKKISKTAEGSVSRTTNPGPKDSIKLPTIPLTQTGSH